MENVWVSLIRADAKRILRDRFLLLIVVYLPLIALAFRWVIPAVAEAVEDDVDLANYYPLICAILVLILPFIMGCVLGLQLLEEKDEHILRAVVVTPFSFRRYFLFRAVIYAFTGMVMLVISHHVMGIVSSISLLRLVAVAISSGLSTPLSAFIIGTLASNQVQGFAVLKGAGFLYSIPALSFFVPRQWDLFFGVIPFYWPLKAYYTSVSGGADALFWIAMTLAIVTQTLALLFLYRIFTRRVIQDEQLAI